MDELLEDLAEHLHHRRDGCPILYAVELSSAALALGLTQDEVDWVVGAADSMVDEYLAKKYQP